MIHSNSSYSTLRSYGVLNLYSLSDITRLESKEKISSMIESKNETDRHMNGQILPTKRLRSMLTAVVINSLTAGEADTIVTGRAS